MAGRKNMPELDRFMSHVSPEPMSGCWLWAAACMKNGYGQFRQIHTHELAHRASIRLFKGIVPDSKMDVMHSCDNPSCVNPDHLSVGTRTNNMRDSIKKGRFQMGMRHYKVKLSEEQVREIYHATGYQREIATRYGTTQATVCRIKSGVRHAALI